MEHFGTLSSGVEIHIYEITNVSGMKCRCINLGATVVSLEVPDREGHMADVVLGLDSLEAYLENKPCFGQTVGRVAGRITGGNISVNGTDYQLPLTDGANHLHGGVLGLGRRVWKAIQATPDSVSFSYLSPDGEEGYPGNVEIRVTYSLAEDNALVIETEATTDAATPLSLTNHSYFQLGSQPDALTHEVQILASHFVPAAEDGTLSGRAEPVAGNDLREPRRLSDALCAISRSHGDNYLLPDPGVMKLAARVREPESGRVMEVITDQACLQFYTSMALDGTLTGKNGRPLEAFTGLCFECQGYPDGLKHPELGDILVQPGVPQKGKTVYRFLTDSSG